MIASDFNLTLQTSIQPDSSFAKNTAHLSRTIIVVAFQITETCDFTKPAMASYFQWQSVTMWCCASFILSHSTTSCMKLLEYVLKLLMFRIMRMSFYDTMKPIWGKKPTKLLPIKSWRLKYFPIFINATGQELFSLPSTRQHIYSRSAEIWIGDGGLVSRSKSNGFVSVAITDKRMLWADGQGMVAWINGAYYIAGWRCHCGYLEEFRGWILFS